MSINPGMTVCGNKNMNILGSIFPEMLSGRKFVDVTLAAEGRRIQCHRVILATYSSYFSDLLEENLAQHPIIIFSSEIKFWMIQALVEFMYRGEVSVREADFGDLMKCAETLKIQGFNHENRIQGTENSLPQREIAEPEEELINEFKTEVLDSEDTAFFYPIEQVFPENPHQSAHNESMREMWNSGESPLMNRFADMVPEIINPSHVEAKNPNQRQRMTSQNYTISGNMETQTTSMNPGGEIVNYSRKKKKIRKIPVAPPATDGPTDFLLPSRRRSFDKKAMWSALMSVKNGMSTQEASRIYKLNNSTIRDYMKKFGIKSRFKRPGYY
ncbi:hypothetical protein DMENIID0001_169600 [Sergentomyia squamirostris]